MKDLEKARQVLDELDPGFRPESASVLQEHLKSTARKLHRRNLWILIVAAVVGGSYLSFQDTGSRIAMLVVLLATLLWLGWRFRKEAVNLELDETEAQRLLDELNREEEPS